MIQFSLKCDSGHRFDSWFQSASAFETLKDRGLVACSVCGSANVEKAVMAPRVTTGRSKEAEKTVSGALSKPGSEMEKAVADLRKKIEAESDYVGDKFVEEARKMHDGDADARSIHGEAKLDDARKLIEDGIPVMPLPFMNNRKAN